MSEKIKNTGESDDGAGVNTGWEEVEAMSEHVPKQIEQGASKDVNEFHIPKHLNREGRAKMARLRLEDSTEDMARLEKWKEEIRKSREFIKNKKFDEQKKAEQLRRESIVEESEMNGEDGSWTEDDGEKIEEVESPRDELESEAERKPLRPEELGLKLGEGESAAKKVLEKQPGLAIVQDIENDDSEFWMNGADKGDGVYATTVKKELENYKKQIKNAKDMGELSKALRIKENVRQALGNNAEVMERFEKAAKEAEYQEKQQQFSGGAAEYERGKVSLAAEDMRKQVVGAEEDLSKIENDLRRYRGLRGMFGKKRAEKAQLKWQRDNAKQRLERMRGDLAELERRLEEPQGD